MRAFYHQNIDDVLAPFPKAHPENMRFLMIGDIVGRPGRHILAKHLPSLKKAFGAQIVVANGENAAGGFGITEKVYNELVTSGVDVVTLGNHWKDKPDIFSLLKKTQNVILPENLDFTPEGYRFTPLSFPSLPPLWVLSLLGNFAMNTSYKNIFEALKEVKSELKIFRQKGGIILVDIHGEASSEKQAVAYFLDGIAHAVYGTHTHVPTADERLLSKGCGYLSDVGMTGPFESIIGMDCDLILKSCLEASLKKKYEVAKNDSWFNAFGIEVDFKTKETISVYRFQYRSLLGHWFITNSSSMSFFC